ncbi:MAG: FMN-binding protein [Planctomycetes bacterium]|nr:FMN-binding protein [Planctomycetota bacterium]
MKTNQLLGFAAATTMLFLSLAAGQTKVPPAAGQPKASPASAPASAPAAGGAQKVMTTAEVDALIDKDGKTTPAWWNQVPLNYPKTLDLTWNQGVKGPQANLGSYLWSTIQPNPAKWKEGIRLMHHVLTVVANDQQKVARTADTLGMMYCNFVQDYARAAFWYRQADNQTGLAKCYFRLGDAKQAKTLLANASSSDTDAILLCIEMGEYDLAIRLSDQLGQSRPQRGYMLSGDAARKAGRYPVAMSYYQKASQTTSDNWLKKFADQAKVALQTLKVFENYDPARLKDGTYSGSCNGYRGPVDVRVVIAQKKIQSVTVVQHKEDGFFYNIASGTIIKAIVDRQNVRGIDAVAGATLTSGAIINATAKALSATTP